MSKRTVICQEWLETERGWGCRPDGASLHITSLDREQFCKEFWDRQPREVPDEYSRESGAPKLIEVDDAMYKRIEETKNGLWLHEYQYRELKKFMSEQ